MSKLNSFDKTIFLILLVAMATEQNMIFVKTYEEKRVLPYFTY